MTYASDFRHQALLIKEQDHLFFEATAKRFGVGKMRGLRWSKQREAQRTRHKPATQIVWKPEMSSNTPMLISTNEPNV